MLFSIIIIALFGAIVADVIHWVHLRRRSPSRHLLFVVWAAATNSLPLVTAILGLTLRDNNTAFMSVAMWLFWGWLVTVPPRLVFYCFKVLHLPKIGLFAGSALVALFIWGATLGRTTIRVSRVEISSDSLPAGFDGFRIVQLSDIHLGTLVCPERELQRIVDSVNRLQPDLIVFSGDLVNIRHTELDARAARILGSLHAEYGVVSVTGNHDVGTYIKDSVALPAAESLAQLVAGQQAIGWCVLQDTTCYLRRGADSISLSGIAFDPALRHIRHDAVLPAAGLHTVYRDVSDSLFNITVVHLPQLWPQVIAAGYGDLTLSGHTHSMQFKLSLFGRDYSPAQWLYERWSGRYDDKGRTLYINDGTGYVAYPMRLGAFPEITLFTLRRCA